MVGVFLSLVFQVVPAADPSVEELEEGFLKERSGLVSGQLRLHVEIERTLPDKAKLEFRQLMFYEPGRLRCDRIMLTRAEEHRTVYCENCERPGCYVFYDDRDLPKNRRPLLLQSMEVPAGAVRRGADLRFDPRVIGVGGRSFFIYHSVTVGKLIGRTDRSPPTIRATEWQGKKAWSVSYRLNHGPSVVDTFVPECGYCMVRHELESLPVEAGADSIKNIMEAEPAQHGSKGRWFPAKVVFHQYRNGALTEKNVIKIEDAAFNEPILPTTFMISGMAIPAGASVNMLVPGAKGAYYWDGATIVQRPSRNTDVEKVVDRPPPIRRWDWSVASIILLVIGIALLGLYLKAKRK